MKINILLPILFIFSACSKQDKWLDVKSNLKDIVPKTLENYQAILDNDGVMNNGYPELGIAGCDNYFVLDASWKSAVTATERNSYVWNAEIYEGTTPQDWSSQYTKIEYCNIVLEGLNTISVDESNIVNWNNARGSALFYRAYAYYNLAQIFASPYDANTSETTLGIPLRTSSDVNEKSVQATLEETYQKIIGDIKESVGLLPSKIEHKSRPSLAASYGLLSRVYLNMQRYDSSNKYAKMALDLYNNLIDFNTLSQTALLPFPSYQNNNPEVIFYALNYSLGITGLTTAYADTPLYKSYKADDLRKNVFYKIRNGYYAFYGTYSANAYHFGGIGTNELYLILAETHARMNNINSAMEALDILLKKRWKTNTYSSTTPPNADAALTLILAERRKELPYTGLSRWEDLRRLNKDTRFATPINRLIEGRNYNLPPNSPLYTYPIPDVEIRLNGLEQNVR